MLHLNRSLDVCNKVLYQQLTKLRFISTTACIFTNGPSTGSKNEQSFNDDDEFRVLDLKRIQQKQPFQRRPMRPKAVVPPPRTQKMAEDQVWSDVWPGPRTFHPAVVPLPVRQGRNRHGPSPDKFGNAELMKIPNFLHLTPPAIKKHCDALKKFCTPWPAGLETDEKCEQHFPIDVITTDYCHSSPTIRDPLARIVTMRFKLGRLPMDRHSRDKFLRLVRDRHDVDTDTVTIVTDRCPLKTQNYQYAHYLLTALFHESWNFEEWEKEKLETDMEYYDWDLNPSKSKVVKIVKAIDPSVDEENLPEEWKSKVDNYREALTQLFNKGENTDTLQNYKDASLKLLF
ncbi:hypothetical protein LSTR_LSTR005182 [Laodelphax striatellus]|uniref:Small ribosomal subunit protein mS35 mitochondrial conserved domain-containing protein n=1 Tax=Laodelphax striatellus TaxID=195883 RepID=A0A482XNE1_LAOST|nr:hypothetical protein LSTR_LSTR005182 [Laodelphax striatellus]